VFNTATCFDHLSHHEASTRDIRHIKGNNNERFNVLCFSASLDIWNS